MRFEKIELDTVERCYAASVLRAGGRFYAVFASESIGGPCYAYTGDRFSEKEVIWEKEGGTMSLIQIPNSDGDFIAVQRFFPGFKSEEAKLVWGTHKKEGGWDVKDLVKIPFVHRFDLFALEDGIYLFAAVLCGSKKDREDWSDPGKILVGKLPSRPEDGMSLKVISQGHTKNHGYCRGRWQGREAAFFTSDEGAFVALPPAKKDGEWKIEKLISRPVSDIALADLDGCGEDELVTIEPFHGNQFVVNKKSAAGYEKVWSYPNEIDFAHTVVGGSLCGKPVVVGGIRRKNCELFVLLHDAETGYRTELVEQGVGTSNAAVAHENGKDLIIAANHTKNEAAIYVVSR